MRMKMETVTVSDVPAPRRLWGAEAALGLQLASSTLLKHHRNMYVTTQFINAYRMSPYYYNYPYPQCSYVFRDPYDVRNEMAYESRNDYQFKHHRDSDHTAAYRGRS